MAKAGWPFVLTALFLALVIGVAGSARNPAAIAGMIFFGFLALGFAFFFRDPERVIPSESRLILAPADGRVVDIKDEENRFLGATAKRVGIFLSVFDVHVNRVPVSGEVAYREYRPGKKLPANSAFASRENECCEIGLVNGKGKVVVRQIAGVLARRIVCRVKAGDKVQPGERFGMIKFGSRVELVLPPSVRLAVSLRQKVKGGETVIGEFLG